MEDDNKEKSFKEGGEELDMVNGGKRKKCKTVEVKGHFRNIPGRAARKRIPEHTRECPKRTSFSVSVPKKPKHRKFRKKW